jgi:hypothetical protein
MTPRLPSLALALAAVAVAPAAVAQPVAARVLEQRGDVRIDGGTVRTGADARVQLQLPGGVLAALGPSSEAELSAPDRARLTLKAGSLRLDATAASAGFRVDLGDRSVLTNGFLKLVPCGEGCAQPPGLYGRIVGGDAVLEYQGGRSVLRNRAFRWPSAAARPEVLARAPALLDDAADHADAQRERAEVTDQLKAGLEAFRDGQDALARQRLEAVRDRAPGDAIVDYYLGLLALRREDNAEALRLLQSYAQRDPEGATAREVGKTLTLLSSSQLQQEVAAAVARESEVVASPPEPNSIAVNAFVNRGDEAYRALAKGIAAMIIADLSKVPGLKVLEREKVQVLMNEMKLGDAGIADAATAVRSGRLMRAEKVIVGNFEVKP